MSMTLNSVNPVSGELLHEWHRNIITISAPIFTVLQALVFYFIYNKSKNRNLYPFLFFPFVYRLAAGLANMLGPNDEGRFGLSIGVGLYTVSILVCTFLFFLIYKTSILNKISLKFNVITFMLCSIFLLFVVFINDYFHIRIIN